MNGRGRTARASPSTPRPASTCPMAPVLEPGRGLGSSRALGRADPGRAAGLRAPVPGLRGGVALAHRPAGPLAGQDGRVPGQRRPPGLAGRPGGARGLRVPPGPAGGAPRRSGDRVRRPGAAPASLWTSPRSGGHWTRRLSRAIPRPTRAHRPLRSRHPRRAVLGRSSPRARPPARRPSTRRGCRRPANRGGVAPRCACWT